MVKGSFHFPMIEWHSGKQISPRNYYPQAKCFMTIYLLKLNTKIKTYLILTWFNHLNIFSQQKIVNCSQGSIFLMSLPLICNKVTFQDSHFNFFPLKLEPINFLIFHNYLTLLPQLPRNLCLCRSLITMVFPVPNKY